MEEENLKNKDQIIEENLDLSKESFDTEENFDLPNETKVIHVYENSNEVPEEIKGWSWGAFGLTFYWSIGNKVYLGLLILLAGVPVIGWIFAIIWKIVMGLKGNEWAWKNGSYKSLEEYKKVQDSWKVPGIVAFAFAIIGVVACIIFFIFFAAMASTIYNYDTY
ncbi:hypothetical protein [Floricoccus penangensis]|uniref:hypothetical protein n=1 Tax=Floricoccus penangensis TaxID=1859475 RepID=UPI001E3F8D13|nr:hypothetical protein [Floricoccus penangensis]